VIGILGAAHYYIWLRFVHAPHLPAPWNIVATLAIVGLGVSMPLSVIWMRMVSRRRSHVMTDVVYMWFGIATYLLLAAALTDVARVFGIPARTSALVAIIGVALTIVYGLVNVQRGARVKRVTVPLAKLPASADGYKIVQLTDVHIGPTLGAAFARQVVERVQALAPDLIVITGDCVDGNLSALAEQVEPLRDLHARDGVYAVTGNHEYYWNADAWIALLGSLGLRFLRNERVRIAAGIELAGVDDSSAAGMLAGHGEDIPRALAGRDPELPVVLLAHHPSSIGRAVAAGADLQLSGHTHGGQLLPLGWLARLFEPRVAGLARFGATWLYVSEGTGFWGPPLRIGTTQEITLITLTRPLAA
jgi:hypothetical protein